MLKLRVLAIVLLVVIVQITALLSSRSLNVAVKVDHKSGKFAISVNQVDWFRSGEVFVTVNGQRFSTYNGTLSAKNIHQADGRDILGEFEETLIDYFVTGANENVVLTGSIRFYPKDGNIVFTQRFPSAVEGSSFGNADEVISSFPSFEMFENNGSRESSLKNDLGFAHWISWFYEPQPTTRSIKDDNRNRRRMLVAPGFATPQFGVWNENTRLSGGMGGSGVTAVFSTATKGPITDRSLKQQQSLRHSGNSTLELSATQPIDLINNVQSPVAAIIAPLTNIMTVSHQSPEAGTLQFGIMGNVTSIPSQFSISVLMHIDASGINKAMQAWGRSMRQWYGKPDASVARSKDVTLQYLGFSTDNGAYYYYHTIPGLDYEQTLIRVKQDADARGIPYKYVLLDSWWYYRGANGGVSEWSPRPDIFPNGLEALYKATGWLVQAHNRYWAEDTVYATQNGGKYGFTVDAVKHGSAPIEQRFWDDLFSYPKAAWGLAVYEQDWMFNEMYQYVSDMLTSVDLARTWLIQMGKGAAKAGLTIQYCMPFIRHMLQSVEIQAVTQVRASDDYVVSPYDGVDNWRIAGQSMLIDAVGLAPSKDGFWSSSFQPGNPYGEERYEPNPRLHAAVATISAGPVQIADGLGYTDVALVLRSCTADGRLLQPSAPATLIDAVVIQRAMAGSRAHSQVTLPSRNPPAGSEVWYAPSIVGGRSYGYIFAADLISGYEVLPVDLDSAMSGEMVYRVFESNNTAASKLFSNSIPLYLPPCGELDFQLWTIAPIEKNGWTFQGELDKWVGVSATRFQSIATVSSPNAGISATAVGSMSETITVGFINPSGESLQVMCVFGRSGVVTIHSSGECTTSSE